jgi:hypothetical protein
MLSSAEHILASGYRYAFGARPRPARQGPRSGERARKDRRFSRRGSAGRPSWSPRSGLRAGARAGRTRRSGNGGIPPFPARRSGDVGRAMLEGRHETRGKAGVGGCRRQPSRLPRRAWSPAALVPIERSQAHPPVPPFGRAHPLPRSRDRAPEFGSKIRPDLGPSIFSADRAPCPTRSAKGSAAVTGRGESPGRGHSARAASGRGERQARLRFWKWAVRRWGTGSHAALRRTLEASGGLARVN